MVNPADAAPPPPASRLRRLAHALARALRLAGRLAVWTCLLTALAATAGVLRTRVDHPAGAAIVNDVTQLNPIPVAEVVVPTTTAEIVAAVRRHGGPISIGGGRFSMGGQTATRGALQLDMRRFNRVLAFAPAARTITVQSGATWRQIQEVIDSAGLAIKIMQTYANFTVGGALSVNAHGRYVGLGPLILSVRSIRVVLPDGRDVAAAPGENPDIFYGVIGGYGGLGVITEVTLDLAPNGRVRRRVERMDVADYATWFRRAVAANPAAVFHNADLYPMGFTEVNAVTFEATDDPVTVPDRLIPRDRSYRLNRFVLGVISEWPLGKGLRRNVVDPVLYRGGRVTWRNYEASYDVAELEPASRARSTYVLQEYFVPVAAFDRFVPLMRAVLQRHDVNVINISIRHALPDTGSLLSWAPVEVFAFVLYYKQGTGEAARASVAVWTRELADAALAVGGSWYLPYQPHATPEQFRRAYPRAREYFALKARLDPDYRFQNTLWDTYYRAPGDSTPPPLTPAERTALRQRPGYARDEGQTFLTHPEWYIVYSPEEYAAWMRDRLPTGFPYVSSIGQFWVNYFESSALTRGRYPFNGGYHLMLMVIGVSYSVEFTVKALYENTIGRLSGWTSGGRLSAEDRFAHEVAADYGRYIHDRPWYEYRFAPRLAALWTELPWWGPHPVRTWERKLFLSVEFGVKALYASLIERATHAAYGVQDDRIQVVATGPVDSIVAAEPRIRLVEHLGPGRALLSLPRWDGFRDVVRDLGVAGAPLVIEEIAGNDEMFVTGVAPAGWRYTGTDAVPAWVMALPADPGHNRVTLRVPVGRLLPLMRGLVAEGRVVIDHTYDY